MKIYNFYKRNSPILYLVKVYIKILSKIFYVLINQDIMMTWSYDLVIWYDTQTFLSNFKYYEISSSQKHYDSQISIQYITYTQY